jgi:hypothetical protein
MSWVGQNLTPGSGLLSAWYLTRWPMVSTGVFFKQKGELNEKHLAARDLPLAGKLPPTAI